MAISLDFPSDSVPSAGLLDERLELSAPLDADVVETVLAFTDNAWMLFALRPGERLPRIEYANARVLEISGFSLDQLTNDLNSFYKATGYADAVLLAVERAKAGETAPFLVQVESAKGMRWVESRVRRLLDGPDGSLRFMTISHDVTEQKRAETFRDLLAETIRQTPEAVFIVRLNDTGALPEIIYANDSFVRLTGYDRIDDYPGILGDASDKLGILAAAQANREGRNTEVETVMYRRDGSTFLARCSAHVVDAPERHAVIVIKDVTEERFSQRQLAMLSRAVEEAEDFVSVVDDTPVHEGGPLVIYTNRSIQSASGYCAEELLGKPYSILHSPNNPAKMSLLVREAIEAGRPAYRELLLRRKDGSDFWVEMTARTFTDPSTNRTLRLSVGRDITLRRRAFNQTALLLEASDQSSDAIVLYEPNSDGDLVPTYENNISEATGKKRLPALWNSDSAAAKRIRAILENGGEVREVFAEEDENGFPTLVQFSARSVRNVARLEAIVTIERSIANADQRAELSGQSLLLRVVGMLPALVQAATTDERIAMLRAILLDAFGAELQASTARPKDDSVALSPGSKGATFGLGRNTYAARWTRDLDSVGLTALRLCIEATIEEERKSAKR